MDKRETEKILADILMQISPEERNNTQKLLLEHEEQLRKEEKEYIPPTENINKSFVLTKRIKKIENDETLLQKIIRNRVIAPIATLIIPYLIGLSIFLTIIYTENIASFSALNQYFYKNVGHTFVGLWLTGYLLISFFVMLFVLKNIERPDITHRNFR